MVDDLNVLIVEDDFFVAGMHADIVNATPGFRALSPARDGRAALQTITSAQPDLLLVDTYLPDGSGIDLLKTADTDAFVLSASDDAANARAALRRGALAYLVKPFDSDDLVARLKAYARYHRVFAAGGSLGQDAIDRAQAMIRPREREKPARSATESAVIDAIDSVGSDASVLDVARVVGVSRATAARYLSGLAESGAVTLRLQYGSTGRPEHRYTVNS